MPRLNRNNSSNEGGNSGKSRSVPSGMKGHKLAQRLPHLSPLVDGTLSKSTRGRNVTSKQTNEFTTPGTHNYTVPKGVDKLTITLYGGGGAGGRGTNPGRGTGSGTGGGGGGGAKVEVVISEIPVGQTFTFTVGTGGMTTNSFNESNHGGTTSFTYNGQAFTAGGGAGVQSAALASATGGTAGLAMGSSSTNIVVTLTQGMTGENILDRSSSNGGCGGISRAGYGSYGQGGSGHHPSSADLNAVHVGRYHGEPGAVIIT